jgi:chromosome segregation ATPase
VRRRYSWTTLVALLAACGSTAPSLSRDERERLPLDARQEIFDAENDLIIARNRGDLAHDQLASVEASLDKLDDVQSSSQRRLAANPATSGRFSLLRQVIRAQRDYLEARQDVAEAEVAVAEQEIRTSKARLSYAKQRQLVRIGKEPSTSLKAFENTIAEEEAKARQTRSSSLDLRTKAQGLLDAWKNTQAQYAAQTGDFDSGIWLE